MLLEMVTKILDKGKEENVDLLTAKDMLVSEFPEHSEILKEAQAVLRQYYDEITEMRRDGDVDGIAELCERFRIQKEKAMEEMANKE